MKRYKFAIALLVLACSMQANTASFTTKRLKGMAEYLSLNGLDTLRTGSYETYSYKGRPLVIRVNKWGEVEHIGLKLFSSGLRELYPSPAYDFLERYLLERNASPTDREEGTKMQWDRVYFSVGSPATALRIDSTAEYNANYYELKVYRVAWSVNGKTVLRMTFDMDYQLMSGCTEIELETNFMRSLSDSKPAKSIDNRTSDFQKRILSLSEKVITLFPHSYEMTNIILKKKVNGNWLGAQSDQCILLPTSCWIPILTTLSI